MSYISYNAFQFREKSYSSLLPAECVFHKAAAIQGGSPRSISIGYAQAFMYHKCPNRTNSTKPGTKIKVELSRNVGKHRGKGQP